MKTKKTGAFRRLCLLALTLTLISSSLMFGTLAKYTTETTVAGTAVVAKWAVKFTDGTNAFTGNSKINLTDTSLNAKVKDGTIAPGTDGSFTVAVDGTNTQVGYKYSITMQEITDMPTNLKFYSDAAFQTELKPTTGTIELVKDAEVALANVGTPKTKTVYWKWAYATANGDAADTADGVAARTASFKLKINATQLDPNP